MLFVEENNQDKNEREILNKLWTVKKRTLTFSFYL